MPGRNREAQIV